MGQQKRRRSAHLDAGEYQQLASFRYALRRFLRFSEAAAEKVGLTAQHYQALLAVCATPGGRVTINDLAQQLLIRHNSAVGLVDRLSDQGLVAREPSPEDGRKVHLRLTAKGDRILEKLAEVHREELRRIGPQLEGLLHEITGRAPRGER
ncbi:MAG TPA: MarR family transcriptional regulator [Burkholderiales bacterium]|jgi:DNA-binding MarR family transcriptional regulator|nr:MarR family transcriptional regulator [Burkholderiales bacterium]